MTHQYRFFIDTRKILDQRYILSGDEFRHCCKVLRKKPGDLILLTDGKGKEFQAEITTVEKHEAQLKIRNVTQVEENILPIHIGIGLIKGQKFDFLIRKLVELGVESITPLKMIFSVKEKVDIRRLERIMISAMKQCGSAFVPKLNEPETLHTWLEKMPSKVIKLAADQAAKITVSGIFRTWKNEPIYLIVGPEGGISSDENNLLDRYGFEFICLNPRRLMTETAALSAVSALYSQLFSKIKEK